MLNTMDLKLVWILYCWDIITGTYVSGMNSTIAEKLFNRRVTTLFQREHIGKDCDFLIKQKLSRYMIKV